MLLTLASLALGQQLPAPEEDVSWARYRACIAAGITTCDLAYLLSNTARASEDEWCGTYTRNRLMSAIAKAVDRKGGAAGLEKDHTFIPAVMQALADSMQEAGCNRVAALGSGLAVSKWCKTQLVQIASARQMQGQERWSHLAAGGRAALGINLTPPESMSRPVVLATTRDESAALEAAANAAAGGAGSDNSGEEGGEGSAGGAGAGAGAGASSAATTSRDLEAGIISPDGLHLSGRAWVVRSSLPEQGRAISSWEHVAAEHLEVRSMLQGKRPTYNTHFHDRPQPVCLVGQLVGPFGLTEVHCAMQPCLLAPELPTALAPCFCSALAGAYCHRVAAHQEGYTAALLHRPAT